MTHERTSPALDPLRDGRVVVFYQE